MKLFFSAGLERRFEHTHASVLEFKGDRFGVNYQRILHAARRGDVAANKSCCQQHDDKDIHSLHFNDSFQKVTDYTHATHSSRIYRRSRWFCVFMFTAAKDNAKPTEESNAPDPARHERWTTRRRSRPEQSINADLDQRRPVPH